MNKNCTLSRRTMLQGAAAAVGTSWLGAKAANSKSSGVLLIGQSAAFSGPAASLGIEMRQGIESAFAQVNASGGIGGRRLQLVSLDDGYEPDRAVANTSTLLDSTQCFALLGYVGTPTTVACLPAINADKVPLVGPFTGAKSLRDPLNSYVFNIRASYDDESMPLIKQLTVASGSAEHIGIVYQDDGYGLAVKASIEAAMAKLGMKPLAVATVKRNSPDVGAAAAAMVKAGVTAVVIGSTYTSSALLMKQIRNLGMHPQFASVSFIGTSGLIDNFADQADGIAIAQVMPYPFSGALPVVHEYQTAMKAAENTKFSYGSIEGYIAARVLVEGLKRCGQTITRAKLRTSLESMDVDIGGFRVAFSADSHQGSKFTELTVLGKGRILR